jgi:hypothetical protein
MNAGRRSACNAGLARAPSATHEPPFSGVARTTGSVRVTPSPGAAATSRTLTTHVVSDLHWKTLHSDNWLTVRVDDQNRVVLYARRPVQFEDPGQVESAHRAAIEALKPLVRARLGLLVDLRNAPDSAEPAAQGRPALRKAEMEAAMAEQRPRLLRDFGRLAFLLKTAVGKLQLDRHLRNDGFDAHITSDEAEALSYLLAMPR